MNLQNKNLFLGVLLLTIVLGAGFAYSVNILAGDFSLVPEETDNSPILKKVIVDTHEFLTFPSQLKTPTVEIDRGDLTVVIEYKKEGEVQNDYYATMEIWYLTKSELENISDLKSKADLRDKQFLIMQPYKSNDKIYLSLEMLDKKKNNEEEKTDNTKQKAQDVKKTAWGDLKFSSYYNYTVEKLKDQDRKYYVLVEVQNEDGWLDSNPVEIDLQLKIPDRKKIEPIQDWFIWKKAPEKQLTSECKTIAECKAMLDLKMIKEVFEDDAVTYVSSGDFDEWLIVIDPGHGGNDGTGAVVGDLHESEINWEIATRIQTSLSDAGFNAVLTKEKNEFLPLLESNNMRTPRVQELLMRHNPDKLIFISVHQDGIENKCPEYSSIIRHDLGTTASLYLSPDNEEFAQALFGKLKTSKFMSELGVKTDTEMKAGGTLAMVREPSYFTRNAAIIEYQFLCQIAKYSDSERDEFIDTSALLTSEAIQDFIVSKQIEPVPVSGESGMTKNQFTSILSAAESPATSEAGDIYDTITNCNLRAEWVAALFRKESTYGKNGVANKTFSISNRKFGNDCVSGKKYVSSSGEYCNYTSWTQSAEHLCSYIENNYLKEGRNTVSTIAPKYCPGSDYCDVPSYVKQVTDFMAQYPQS